MFISQYFVNFPSCNTSYPSTIALYSDCEQGLSLVSSFTFHLTHCLDEDHVGKPARVVRALDGQPPPAYGNMLLIISPNIRRLRRSVVQQDSSTLGKWAIPTGFDRVLSTSAFLSDLVLSVQQRGSESRPQLLFANLDLGPPAPFIGIPAVPDSADQSSAVYKVGGTRRTSTKQQASS